MKDICPILSDPLIAKEFNELKQAVGEKAAYHIWSLNNGNGIDKAPNGEPSILFLSLLELTNGNRIKAILLKANAYRPSFISLFGDWLSDENSKSAVSIPVDQNGEPINENGNVYFENIIDKDGVRTADDRLRNLSELKRDEYSISDILEIVKSNPEYSNIINAMLHKNNNIFSDIHIVIEDPILAFSQSIQIREKYKGRRAFYDASTKTIYINAESNFQNGDSSNVLFHEIIHAVTVNKILSNPSFKKLFQLIIKDYLKLNPNDRRYIENPFSADVIEEFVANVWTDPKTRNILKNTISPRDNKTLLWSIIKLFFAKILKSCVPNSLYEEASDLIFNLLDSDENIKSSKRYYDSEPIIEDFESYLEKRDEYDKELDQLIEDDESLREYLLLEEEVYVEKFINNNENEDGTRIPSSEDIEQERITARKYFYRNKIATYLADLHDYLYSYLANKNKMNVVNEMVKGSVIGTSIGFGTAFLTGGSSILIGGTIGAIVGTLRAISNNHNVRTTLDDEALLDRIYNLISQDKPELAKLGLLLFRNSLLGVRPEHNIRTIVEQYIYAYQDSNVIQNALKVLNAGRNIDTPKLVLELADGISDRFLNSNRKQRNIKHLENFNDVRNLIWNKIRNFFRKPINEENKESLYKERRRVFADLQACIAANEELDKCSDEELIFNLSKWTISGEELTVDENKTLKAILKGIKSRIKSMQSVSNGVNDPEELQRLIEWRDEILAILKEEDSDEKVLKLQEQISKFLNIGIVELAKIARLLNEMSNSPIDKTKYKDLMRIKTDIVGFYKNINSLYIQQYAQSTDSPLFKEGGEHYNDIKLIRDTIVSLAVVYDKLLLRYTDYLIDTVADDYVDIGDKERFKLNAKMWLRNSIDGGTLSFFENFTNSAATSASPIVRIVDMYIREANLATRQETFERGLKLLLLYDKCEPLLNKVLPSNFMRYFMEMDDEGKPTGNLINPFNIGLFELRKRAIIKKLDDKYEVKYDEDTNKRIFKDHETSIKYYDEYDEELDKIGAVRRFKKEYYKAKRHILSEETIARLDGINSQIQRIKQKAIENIEVDGRIILIVNQTKLSPTEKRELKILNEIKSLLSSEYRIIKDDSGNIVLFEQKTGIELLIAKELLEFSNFLQSYSSETKADKELYQSVKQQLIDKYGEDSEEVKQFVRDYSRRDATDDFYKTLTSESIELSEEVLNLKNRKRLILKSILVVSGLYRNKYDFRKLNNEALEELRRIDEELDEKTQHILHTDEYIQWSRENVSNINLGITGDSKSFLDSEYNKITRLYPGNDSKLDELYYDKYFYVNKKGERIPLSIFFAVTPLLESYIDEEKPTGIFLYSENFLKDSRYDESNRASIQFDKEMYRNKDYEKKIGKFIDKDGKPKNAIAEFYLELLKTLNDAWSKIPNIERANFYQLPQRRDRSSHLVTRKGLINNMKAVLSNTFTINENDLLFNEEFSQRPDGTIVETIPLRWIRPLKDPSTISTDILGSIVDFYEMATNFQAKLGISAIAEALRLLTMGGIQQERETDQSKRIATQESMFIYGRMVSGFGSKVKLSRVERALAKLLQNLRGSVFYKLMAHNWMTVMKNLIDSSCSLYAEIAGGKYFTVGMFWDSVKDMGIELFKGQAFNVGKTLTNGFTSCAMQYNGVSGSIHELFSNRNETRLRRILSLHFDTGEYTLVDYTFKGLITNMVYKSYKYIQNPQTLQYEFMNIDKVKYIYSQAGLSKLAAVDAFNKSKITLKDAYVPTNGTLILKDEYKNVVKPSITDFNRKSSLKLELRIQGIIKERSGVINGMLDDMDRGKLHQNYVGALIMQMRGWMIAQFSDYTKRGHDFDKISDNEQLTKQSLYEFIKAKTFGAEGQILEQSRDYAGQFNFTSGTVDVGIWRNLVKSYWNYTKAGAELSKYINNNKVSDQELYAVKRMNATIFGFLFTVAMTVGLGIASTMYGGDDPEKIKETNPSKYYSWLALYFAYGSFMSSINERSSQLWYPGFVSTVSDIWNSPTVAKSYIDDAHYMWDFGKDLVQYADYWITDGQESEYEIFDKVKGNTSFRGMSKFKSDFLRATSEIPGLNKYGIANVYKNTTKTGITQKYNYYYQKVFPTEFAVESGYWTLDKLGIYHKPEKTKQTKIINPR